MQKVNGFEELSRERFRFSFWKVITLNGGLKNLTIISTT
jgi:hypothetical protein